MKNLNFQDLLLLVFLFSLAFGCQQGDQSEEPKKTSSAELKDQIKTQVDSLYSVYEKFGYDWIDFYDNEFTAIYPNSPVKVNSRDSLKAQWDGIYEKFTVKLVERGEPTIIESEDMAISYNSFNEIFIDKKTNDTVKNVGTYIVAWKRQADDSWKIVFETLHNN
ncbi:YybH family protein [Algoriphagus aquimarinus]|uniref:DUF4440 domain-containing protein n=1 Tax=Algoriphagus aquimarinus TaxID=237018 RepID=A0A1I1BV26_9BACT|nr:hypothetical protein [Algoriphagus aquimarinus]SFB54259.1 hypothetical protein SAMN04489723_11857 [Algoriphagus aquimarinus]